VYFIDEQDKIELVDFGERHRSAPGIESFFVVNGLVQDKLDPNSLLERAGKKYLDIMWIYYHYFFSLSLTITSVISFLLSVVVILTKKKYSIKKGNTKNSVENMIINSLDGGTPTPRDLIPSAFSSITY
jgi:hypothetical protein